MPGRHRTRRGTAALATVRAGLRSPFALRLDRRRTAGLASACVLLVAAAVVSLLLLPGSVLHRPPSPPAPVAAGRATAPASAAETGGSTNHRSAFHCRAATNGGSESPRRICIPQIRVDATVMRLGLNSDRTVEVPPLSQVGDAGWFKYSAKPGAVGPTVILGHVDSAQYGEGVFFELSRLHRGDLVTVARGDGHTAVYAIDTVEQISKKRFPTKRVYGPTSGPAIRLVTCGGRFDASTGNYEDNIIAYGTLRTVR